MRSARPGVPSSFEGVWLGVVGAAFVCSSLARAQGGDDIELIGRRFQFRVNKTSAESWGVTLDDAAIAVKPDGGLSCVWTSKVGGSTSPSCTNLLTNCDGEEVTAYGGFAHSNPNAVDFAREFDWNGRARSTTFRSSPRFVASSGEITALARSAGF